MGQAYFSKDAGADDAFPLHSALGPQSRVPICTRSMQAAGVSPTPVCSFQCGVYPGLAYLTHTNTPHSILGGTDVN